MMEAYGGSLVWRVTAEKKSSDPILTINSIIESDFLNIATGAFSPLIGFMDSKNFHRVCESARLQNDLVWTIPIVFDITEEQKKQIEGAKTVFLKSESGNLIGFIEPTEIYKHDKDLRIRGTYGTSDDSHPGVKLVKSMGPYLLAGAVTAFQNALNPDPLAYTRGVRAKLQEMGLQRVTGFQTRNVIHRAHEYLQRVALEVSDGLLVQPVVGWKKTGDFRPEAVKLAYSQFIANYFPRSRVLLTFLNLAMRYAGPKEAVFHAIVRKNYGCSHFIVGRDHAGVGGFYGTYEAHEYIAKLPPIGIEFLRLREPFYCKACDGVATDKTCGHNEDQREYISATKIRKILVEGGEPGNHIFRKEVLDSLKPLKEAGLFYE